MDITNRADIELLINCFYDKVKADDIISYIFNDVAKVDWPHHLPIMYDFWEGVIFYTNTYRGNPMQVHKDLNLKEPLTAEHFKRWLELFVATVSELFEGDKAELAKQRAMSIAVTIQVKLAAVQF
jgi:hemoglobin